MDGGIAEENGGRQNITFTTGPGQSMLVPQGKDIAHKPCTALLTSHAVIRHLAVLSGPQIAPHPSQPSRSACMIMLSHRLTKLGRCRAASLQPEQELRASCHGPDLRQVRICLDHSIQLCRNP